MWTFFNKNICNAVNSQYRIYLVKNLLIYKCNYSFFIIFNFRVHMCIILIIPSSFILFFIFYFVDVNGFLMNMFIV